MNDESSRDAPAGDTPAVAAMQRVAPPRTRGALRLWLAAGAGAAVMLAVGAVYARTGAQCAILCRPPVAGVYGAVMGLLLIGGVTKPR